MQYSVQMLSGGEVTSEGLFDDDACALGAPGAGQCFNHSSEEAGWNSQVVRGVLGPVEHLA